MEGSGVTGLRSRSRSKTPFLRSSCDRENCTEGGEHTHHKSGRKTPVKRSTPVKQLGHASTKLLSEPIEELEEDAPAHHTRMAEKLMKTSDYSSEESLDRLKSSQKEIVQNEINSQYERISTSSRRYGTLEDVTLSPIHLPHNLTNDRSRFGSPAYSGCSSDSSFAEQALADASLLLEREPSTELLPYRLYKMAGEYWNKYPKTDYTYSPLSRDRVELAPGQVAVPNMSRRSLANFRTHGPVTSTDEIDCAVTEHTLRKRYASLEGSDDEASYLKRANGYQPADRRWWITRLLVAIVTTITTTTSSAYRSVVGPPHRYPYTERRPAQAGIVSRTAAVAAAPFYWIYTIIKKVVTTTVTTVTETITPNHVGESEKHVSRSYQQQAKRRWWPWLLLLLLPVLGYGSHYTYENLEHFTVPNFTDFRIDLSEFTALELPKFSLPSMPNISLPELSLPTFNLTMPEINITLPDLSDNLPEVSKTYNEYKDIVQNRMEDASDYVRVVAKSCGEELRRFWRGIIG